MAAQKACKKCKAIYEGAKCPNCGASSEDSAETFKGRIVVLDEERSEIAKNVKITKKGTFAVKLG
ncbi:MAG TPA: transcription elongation factor subunit Spt4 [Candidatus Nanoarchaeia archaeon]|nr:transcription elongation factor subunit Spt4 [Candidatus Nanoarchaeia archaeon]